MPWPSRTGAAITGTSGNIAVSAAAATHFTVSAPGTATAGTSFNVIVAAQDQFNNTATGYSGNVHFTSTDGAAVLPANYALSSGVGTFSVTLKTAGNQTITASDTVRSSITGTSGAVSVGSGGGGGGGGGGGSPIGTTTTATASPSSSNSGQSVTYGATVTPSSGGSTPTGTVTFTVGTTTLCTATLAAGKGTCVATNAPVGTDTVTATYSGDGTFAGSTGTTTETVTAMPPQTAPIFTALNPP